MATAKPSTKGIKFVYDKATNQLDIYSVQVAPGAPHVQGEVPSGLTYNYDPATNTLSMGGTINASMSVHGGVNLSIGK